MKSRNENVVDFIIIDIIPTVFILYYLKVPIR